jgi:hypothetical protein
MEILLHYCLCRSATLLHIMKWWRHQFSLGEHSLFSSAHNSGQLFVIFMMPTQVEVLYKLSTLWDPFIVRATVDLKKV